MGKQVEFRSNGCVALGCLTMNEEDPGGTYGAERVWPEGTPSLHDGLC